MSFEVYYNDYKTKRDNLVNAMSSALDAGDFDKFNSIKAEVDELDKTAATNKEMHAIMSQVKDGILEPGVKNENKTFEDVQNDVNAMVESMAINNIDITGGNDMGSFGTNVVDTTATNVLEAAFANLLMGVTLSAEQQTAYNNLISLKPTDNGSVAVPDTVVYRIYDAVKASCPIIADCKPELSDNNTIVFRYSEFVDPEVVAEGFDVTQTDDDNGGFVPVRLPICDIIKTIKLTNRTQRIAPDAFIDMIVDKAKDLIVITAEKIIVEYMTTKAANTITCKATTGNTFGIATIKKALAQLSGVNNNTAIYANSYTIWNDLATLVDNTGRDLFVAAPATENGVTGYINGVPVKVTGGNIPNSTILVANPATSTAIVFGDTLTTETDRHPAKGYTDFVFNLPFSYEIVYSRDIVKITGTNLQTVSS